MEPGSDDGDGEDQLLHSPERQQPQRDAQHQNHVGDVEQQLDGVVELARCGSASQQGFLVSHRPGWVDIMT